MLVVHRGKIHDYLGMDLDYSKEGKIKVCMIRYLIKLIQVFPELIEESAPPPAADYIFKVRDDDEAVMLSDDRHEYSTIKWYSCFS